MNGWIMDCQGPLSCMVSAPVEEEEDERKESGIGSFTSSQVMVMVGDGDDGGDENVCGDDGNGKGEQEENKRICLD